MTNTSSPPASRSARRRSVWSQLKGERRSASHAVPAGADLTKDKTVAIWREQFGAPFGAAPLAKAV